MKLEEIIEIAKLHEIKVGRLKKAELIRSIQLAESNSPCFNSGMVNICGHENCCWRGDCA